MGTFSTELMVTPAAQETTMCLAWTSAPISSRMKGMMCGFTARNRTSLCLTVSFLLRVRFTAIFCGRRPLGSRGAGTSLGPGTPKEQLNPPTSLEFPAPAPQGLSAPTATGTVFRCCYPASEHRCWTRTSFSPATRK